MILGDLLPAISNFFNEYQALGVLLAGIIAFIESLAIIGSIVPGSIVMTIVGFLLGVGAIPLTPTLISVFIGAFIGDFISYSLGSLFKDRIKNHHWISPYAHWLTHGERFMQKHGALSIFIGRFVGPMRSMIPMIAGIAEMNLIIFTLAIIPTILLWAIVYLTPGILLGSLSIDMGESMFTIFLSRTLLTILFIALWVSIGSITRLFFPILEKRELHLSLDCETFTHLIKAISLFLLALVFLASSAIKHPQHYWLNPMIHHAAMIYTSSSRIEIAKSISLILSPMTYVLLNIVSIGILHFHKHRTYALYWFILSSGLFILTSIMKFGLHVPRPHPLLIETSLPSGHVLLLGSFFLSFSLILERYSKSIGKISWWVSIAFIIMIALSRIILQAHWASDIIISMLLCLSLAHALATFKKHIPIIPQTHIKQLGACLLLIIIPLSIIESYLPRPYSPKLPEPITVNQVFDIHNLPTLRYSRVGYPSAPLNFIFQGSKQALDQYFNRLNWQAYPSHGSSLKRIITLFKFREYHDVLPILPALVNNHAPDAIYGLITDDSAYIAKLWQLEGRYPTFIGTVSKETYPESFFNNKLFVCQKSRFNIQSAFPNQNYQIIQKPAVTQERCVDAFSWDGKVAWIKSDT